MKALNQAAFLDLTRLCARPPRRWREEPGPRIFRFHLSKFLACCFAGIDRCTYGSDGTDAFVPRIGDMPAGCIIHSFLILAVNLAHSMFQLIWMFILFPTIEFLCPQIKRLLLGSLTLFSFFAPYSSVLLLVRFPPFFFLGWLIIGTTSTSPAESS